MRALLVVTAEGADEVSEQEAASVEYLRTHYLDPPSSLAYNLSRPKDTNPSMGQAQAVDKILHQMVRKCNGRIFFCEVTMGMGQ